MPASYVIKANGEKEPFSFQKIFKSAVRVGAPKQLALEIAEKIERESYPEIATSDIFKKVNKLLRERSKRSALRFNLKRGIRELGPTGFPFEKYVGEIFRSLGFKVKINHFIPGYCISNYEIDFIAEKDDLIYLGECKYRNIFSDKVDLKDALANYARFSDILNGLYFKSEKQKNTRLKTILVTNGKFTRQAINYSNCMGVDLLGWRFPKNRSLEYLVESQKLYPITILPFLKGYLKKVLVEKQLMLVKDILDIDPVKFAQKTKLQARDIFPLIKEARLLLEE